jgi:tRNA pseudouridine38-40 synthase
MRNVKVILEYDGSDFHGWQIQAGGRTVQGVLEEILSRLDHRPVTVHGAGRTDAGVHAEAQVANFLLQREMAEVELLRAINGNLPYDVRVKHVELVAPDFHARHDAVEKTYRYRMFLGRIVSPFLYRYVYQLIFPVDVAAMQRAAQSLIGEHDFASFSTRERKGKTTVRRVTELRLSQEDDLLTLEISANGFLRYMVRTIAGTLCEVGRGRIAVEAMPQILQARDRGRAGPTLPAKGLTLVRVRY